MISASCLSTPGNLGFYGAWSTLVRAARLLESEGVGLIFIGEGARKVEVEAEAAGCRAVRFLPYFPARDLPSVLASGDLHVVTVKRGLEGVVVPSKLYPLLAAGRPILGVAPSGTDVVRILNRTGCGVSADPDNPESVAGAVRSLLADPERLGQMSLRARAASIFYDRVKQVQVFISTIEEVASECQS